MRAAGATHCPCRDDGQLPVQGVVVQQRGLHQAVVPVARQFVPGAVQGAVAVHGGVRHHQHAVPKRVHRSAKRVRQKKKKQSTYNANTIVSRLILAHILRRFLPQVFAHPTSPLECLTRRRILFGN